MIDNLDSLFEAVESHVSGRQEQDKWEAVADQQFPTLCDGLFNRLEILLYPMKSRLVGYSRQSVDAVWETTWQGNEYSVRFGNRNLKFRPIGADAQQEGDRFTVQVLRNHDALVLRFIMMYSQPTGEMKLGIINHTSMTEPLDDRHLIQLLIEELLG